MLTNYNPAVKESKPDLNNNYLISNDIFKTFNFQHLNTTVKTFLKQC